MSDSVREVLKITNSSTLPCKVIFSGKELFLLKCPNCEFEKETGILPFICS
jgi:hypothetical protein